MNKILVAGVLILLVLVFNFVHSSRTQNPPSKITSDPIAAYARSAHAAQQDLQQVKAAADQLGQIPAAQKEGLDP